VKKYQHLAANSLPTALVQRLAQGCGVFLLGGVAAIACSSASSTAAPEPDASMVPTPDPTMPMSKDSGATRLDASKKDASTLDAGSADGGRFGASCFEPTQVARATPVNAPKLHQNKCSAALIADLVAKCFSTAQDGTACNAAITANDASKGCWACMLGSAKFGDAPSETAAFIFTSDFGGFVNVVGCQAAVAGSTPECAGQLAVENYCAQSTCKTCTEITSCSALAVQSACKPLAAPVACHQVIEAKQAQIDSACGTFAGDFAGLVSKAATVLCGM
jgi:hypothetical protein